jgi:hypothetical protein
VGQQVFALKRDTFSTMGDIASTFAREPDGVFPEPNCLIAQ